MAAWDPTHGKARGAYLRSGDLQIYVRQALGPDSVPTSGWLLYVDGRLEGRGDEAVVKAWGEAADRLVVDAGVAGEATAARDHGRAA